MKFIVDAHLPPSLAKFIIEKGHACVHTSTLPLKNFTHDNEIIKISMNEMRVVITKDSDFLQSFILKREPYKLIFVTTGNYRTRDLILLFKNNFDVIIKQLQYQQVLELDQSGITVIY